MLSVLLVVEDGVELSTRGDYTRKSHGVSGGGICTWGLGCGLFTGENSKGFHGIVKRSKICSDFHFSPLPGPPYMVSKTAHAEETAAKISVTTTLTLRPNLQGKTTLNSCVRLPMY